LGGGDGAARDTGADSAADSELPGGELSLFATLSSVGETVLGCPYVAAGDCAGLLLHEAHATTIQSCQLPRERRRVFIDPSSPGCPPPAFA